MVKSRLIKVTLVTSNMTVCMSGNVCFINGLKLKDIVMDKRAHYYFNAKS